MKEIRRLLVLQHLEIEGPGLFEQFAKERELIKEKNIFYFTLFINFLSILFIFFLMGLETIFTDHKFFE